MDWRENGIIRETTILADDPGLSNRFVYISNNTNAMRVEVSVNPFSQNCQRIADFLYFLDKRSIASVRLILIPPSNQSISSSALSRYYRASFATDLVTLAYVDDSAKYQTTFASPHAWGLNIASANFDITEAQFRGNNSRAEFTMANLIVEGPINGSGEPIELSVNKVRTVATPENYFQLPLQPGESVINLSPRDPTYSIVPERVCIESLGGRNHTIDPKRSSRPSRRASGQTASRAHVLLATCGGKINEDLTRMTIMSAAEKASVLVDFWVIGRFPTVDFINELNDITRVYGCRKCHTHVIPDTWPSWIRPPQVHTRAASVARLLFFDMALPLSVERIIALEPGTAVRGDIAELIKLNLPHSAPITFVPFPDNATKRLRGGLFAADLGLWRRDKLGQYVRSRYLEFTRNSQ
jgi:hypothetical protein